MSNTAKMQLAEIEERIANLTENLSKVKASQITIDLISQEVEKLNADRAHILDEIARQTQRKKVIYEKIDFPCLDFEEKKIVAKNYIEKVILTEDECQIVWKV